jgi:hypothetical protein
MTTTTSAPLIGRVEATLILQDFRSSRSTPVPKIEVLIRHGVRGDRHAGGRLIDAREKLLIAHGFRKGAEIANHREASIVSTEDLAHIQAHLGLPTPIPPGCLGENLVVSGIPDLSELPTGTFLLFQNGETIRNAVLTVWDENHPCLAPGAVLQEQYPERPGLAAKFVRAARSHRGLVASAYSSGVIKPGDTVIAYPPPSRNTLPP